MSEDQQQLAQTSSNEQIPTTMSTCTSNNYHKSSAIRAYQQQQACIVGTKNILSTDMHISKENQKNIGKKTRI